MLVSASEVLPLIKIDYKRIELLRRASTDKSIKITPELLKKLNSSQSVEDVLVKPSTSGAAAKQKSDESPPQPAPRRNVKRKAEEAPKSPPKEEEKCLKCNCKMLRVVDPKRPDKRRILECTRATCLASIKFTDLPVGTVIGKEVSSNRSVYNSLARYYPKSRYTPTPEGEDDDSEELLPNSRHLKKSTLKHPQIFESNARGVFIHVPGQEVMARLV